MLVSKMQFYFIIQIYLECSERAYLAVPHCFQVTRQSAHYCYVMFVFQEISSFLPVQM
jgi:hypothetical protein